MGRLLFWLARLLGSRTLLLEHIELPQRKRQIRKQQRQIHSANASWRWSLNFAIWPIWPLSSSNARSAAERLGLQQNLALAQQQHKIG